MLFHPPPKRNQQWRRVQTPSSRQSREVYNDLEAATTRQWNPDHASRTWGEKAIDSKGLSGGYRCDSHEARARGTPHETLRAVGGGGPPGFDGVDKKIWTRERVSRFPANTFSFRIPASGQSRGVKFLSQQLESLQQVIKFVIVEGARGGQ